MPKAIWNGAVIAEAAVNETEIVEGNTYFPAASVNAAYLQPSDHHTSCPWKGTASYYSIAVDGKINQNAAWFYPQPAAAARQIAGMVAFWRGVEVRV